MKKGKSNALLVELLIVTLFFALAAAVLVEVFAAAGNQSGTAERLNQAQTRAQDVAEQLYAAADPQAWLAENGFTQDGETFVRDEDRFRLEATLSGEQTESGSLLRAEVRAMDGDEALIALPVTKYSGGVAE